MGPLASAPTLKRLAIGACAVLSAALLVWCGAIFEDVRSAEEPRGPLDRRAIPMAALAASDQAALEQALSGAAPPGHHGPDEVYVLGHGRVRLVRVAPGADPEDRWVMFGIAAVIGAGLGVWLALAVRQRQRRRLRTLVQTLDLIGRGQLKRRLPVSNEGDALDRISALVNETVERLARLMEMLQEQADHIRHEYGNSAARMGVYLARIDALDEPLPAVAAEAIGALERERRHFMALTGAILNLWQARQGGQEVHEQDLAMLAGEVVDITEGRADEKRIRLIDELHPAPVMGDARMLTLMISNLLDNAVKYTPSGGLVRLRCVSTAGRVGLTVEDSGPGIALEKRELVFEPRERLAGTAELEGKGYGLAIVKAIVQLHFGRIEIRGSDLGGACFSADFPIAAEGGELRTD